MSHRDVSVSRQDVRIQVLWYALVGGVSFACDLVVFVGLLRAGAPVMFAFVVGFVTGTLVNYVLSRTLAFIGGRFSIPGEIARLAAVAIVGLLLTALAMALLLRLGLPPVAAKIVATLAAFVWNYLGRRRWVFHRAMPIGTWSVSAALVSALRRARPSGGKAR